MDQNHPTELTALRSELSAYLDGELNESGSQRVEELLSADPLAREELKRLQRAWDLLDQLPRADVTDLFTRTTVAMVAKAAAEDIDRERRSAPGRRRRQAIAALGGMLASCVVGFALVRALWPDSNQQLVRDLTVLENLDPYRQASDIEFLRMLDREDVFPEESTNE
jgi:anti-sigma factor RsiW